MSSWSAQSTLCTDQSIPGDHIQPHSLHKYVQFRPAELRVPGHPMEGASRWECVGQGSARHAELSCALTMDMEEPRLLRSWGSAESAPHPHPRRAVQRGDWVSRVTAAGEGSGADVTAAKVEGGFFQKFHIVSAVKRHVLGSVSAKAPPTTVPVFSGKQDMQERLDLLHREQHLSRCAGGLVPSLCSGGP
ncbi:hypothetical protein Cadr_000028676 [Camelus dromedarius]|uniref:Uncharacterized protein n=1 Tax=Camelus dromedarius TaxID=9838 RepID=A0A5N4C7P7_CAMDR|nr:hypothetical protein Cadr_000028676 [Camelus dromedarius]